MTSTENPTFPDTGRDGAALYWTASAVKELAVVALASGITGAYTLSWGDGSSSEATGGAGPVSHTYQQAGAYRLTARAGATILAQAQVYVRAGMAPNVTFATSAEEPNVVQATVNDDPEDLVSRYRFVWAPGVEQTVFAAKGTVLRQGFAAGTHQIQVTDLHTGRTLRDSVTVVDKTYDPAFTIAQGGDAQTAVMTLSVVGTVKDIVVDWGDGTQDTITSPAVGTTKSHTYVGSHTLIVQAAYADGTGEGDAKLLTIPFPDMAGDRS